MRPLQLQQQRVCECSSLVSIHSHNSQSCIVLPFSTQFFRCFVFVRLFRSLSADLCECGVIASVAFMCVCCCAVYCARWCMATGSRGNVGAKRSKGIDNDSNMVMPSPKLTLQITNMKVKCVPSRIECVCVCALHSTNFAVREMMMMRTATIWWWQMGEVKNAFYWRAPKIHSVMHTHADTHTRNRTLCCALCDMWATWEHVFIILSVYLFKWWFIGADQEIKESPRRRQQQQPKKE